MQRIFKVNQKNSNRKMQRKFRFQLLSILNSYSLNKEYIEKIAFLEQELANQKFLLSKELAKKNLCIQQLETKLKTFDIDSTKSNNAVQTAQGKHPMSANSGITKKIGPEQNYNSQLNYMKAMHQKKDILYNNPNISKDKDSSSVFNKTFSTVNQANLNCTQQIISHHQQQKQIEQLNTIEDQMIEQQNINLWKQQQNNNLADIVVQQQSDKQQSNISRLYQDENNFKPSELLSKYFQQKSSMQFSQQPKPTEENSQYQIVDRKQKYQQQYQKIPKQKLNWHQKQVSMIQRSQYLPEQNLTYRLGNTNQEEEQQSCYSKLYKEQYQQQQQQQIDDNKKKLHQIVQHVDRNHQNIAAQQQINSKEQAKNQLETSINKKAITQSFRSSSVDANNQKLHIPNKKNDSNQALANLIMNKTIQQLNQSQCHQNSNSNQQQQQKIKVISGIPNGQLNLSSGFKKN